jgi:tetratricopeptide (TPR) repeat protein
MSTPLPGAHDLETICLIWLDASANVSAENIATQKQIQTITPHFKIFQNVKDCEQYIRQKCKDDRIFFIVSGQLGREIVPRIHQCRQIFSIYVYCQNKQLNEEWANKFAKVKGVVVQSDILIHQIQSNYTKRIQTKVDEPFPINISKSNPVTDITVDNEFFYSQILFDCLLQMKTISTDKSDFINLCKNEYHNNTNELSRVQEFQQTYIPNQALWWYTRESFVNRVLNKALYTKNLDLLFLFAFLIRDIHENLEKNKCKSPIQVCHGQLMSIDELHALKNSIGKYISVNTFLSGNSNRKQIISCLNEWPVTDDLVRILFEIDADPQKDNSKPFAYLSQEQQICLFTLGTIFQLTDIIQDKKNDLWIVKLVLTTIKKEYDSTNLISCGYFLFQQMKKTDQAEKYFSRLLKELPSDHPDIAQCLHSLGLLLFLRNQYDLSLQWYQKLIKILKTNDPNLPDTFYSIGCVYHKKSDHQQALEYYQKALQIWTENNRYEQPLRMADCLNNMGCIYETEGSYTKSLDCHQQALSIRGQYQMDIGASYNNIGNVYLCLGQYEVALENYNYSFEMKSKSISIPNPSLATTLKNIGLVYEEDGNIEEALKCYKRAALMFEQIYPSVHIYNIEIQEDIQRILALENV